jgi:hypothetical protein
LCWLARCPFEIKTIQFIDGASPPTAIVTATIDGKEYKLKVCDNAEISWAE